MPRSVEFVSREGRASRAREDLDPLFCSCVRYCRVPLSACCARVVESHAGVACPLMFRSLPPRENEVPRSSGYQGESFVEKFRQISALLGLVERQLLDALLLVEHQNVLVTVGLRSRRGSGLWWREICWSMCVQVSRRVLSCVSSRAEGSTSQECCYEPEKRARTGRLEPPRATFHQVDTERAC